LTYAQNRSHKDIVSTQKGQECLGRCHEFPGNDRNTDKGAEDLASNNGDVAREETGNIGRERDEVGPNVGPDSGEEEAEGLEEDRSPGS
jgi:hypothetical protein